MSLDAQFVKDVAFAKSEDDTELETGQGLVWPAIPSLPNQIYQGAFKISPFIEFFDLACDEYITGTLEPDEVASVAQRLNDYVQELGPNIAGDQEIPYDESDPEETLSYAWIRDLNILFQFAAQERLFLFIHR